MPLFKLFEGHRSIIASPLFIVSQPRQVIAACRAGVIGTFPSLNARSSGVLEE